MALCHKESTASKVHGKSNGGRFAAPRMLSTHINKGSICEESQRISTGLLGRTPQTLNSHKSGNRNKIEKWTLQKWTLRKIWQKLQFLDSSV
jgi:hypothetical protein